MVKTCARCEKTVYPIEELKCLDKTWHKQCFKCQVCQMTLNMRNYKGFNKDPYCEAHIPKAKATTVAETPEYKRIAENTKIQSNVKYHEDFEKAKGKFTQVADDPETRRIKANSKNISNVAYHGDLEKKANMEKLRNIGENGEEAKSTDPSSCAVHQQHHHQQQQQQQPQQQHHHQQQQPQRSNPVQKTSQHDPHANSGYTARQSSTVIYTSDRGPVSNPPDRRIGSIQDLDPVNDFYGSLASDHDPKGTASEYYGRNYAMHPNEYHQQQQQQAKYPQSNYPYSSSHQQQPQQQQPQQQQQYNRGVSNGHQRSNPQMGYGTDYRTNNVPSVQPTQQPVRQQSRTSGRVYRAMYDYKAQDSDEVSFIDGDIIVDCTPIDDGWLTGIVKRTGQSGLLPANYVTPAI